jgi:hypothetical protein
MRSVRLDWVQFEDGQSMRFNQIRYTHSVVTGCAGAPHPASKEQPDLARPCLVPRLVTRRSVGQLPLESALSEPTDLFPRRDEHSDGERTHESLCGLDRGISTV